MSKIRAILTQKLLVHFAYFYRYIGRRVIFSVVLSLLVGILDSLGLSMFLPLLQMIDPESPVNPEKLGKLRFLIDGMNELGFSLTIGSVLMFLCVFFVFKGFAQYFRNTYQVVLQQYFIKKMRFQLIRLFDSISYKYFAIADAGRIQNTLSGEVDRVSRAYQTYFTALQNIIMVMVYVVFAFFLDFKFALLVCAGGIVTNLIFTRLYKKTKGASRELTHESHVFQNLIIQRVANFKYLKATGSRKVYSKKLSDSVSTIEENNRRIGILGAILSASREPLLIFVVSAVIIVQTQWMGGALGPILVALMFFYRALTYLMVVQTQWNLFIAVSGSLSNMTEFTNELKRNREEDGSGAFNRFEKQIELQDVTFGYSEDTPVLRSVNLVVDRNETIAFVGESGSGKTTLVNLLAGLVTPDKGRLMIDGFDILSLKRDDYQSRIGYITQDPAIFNDTVFNNITFWAEPTEENERRFRDAVKKASLFEVIEAMESKEQTVLGTNGVNLSGGQKQRISIARELYKDIDILILDEATSALDSETERAIQENIDNLKGTYTILIVAHRLSTVRNADRIVLMEKGSIQHTDTFTGLMESSPNFARMVKLQEL